MTSPASPVQIQHHSIQKRRGQRLNDEQTVTLHDVLRDVRTIPQKCSHGTAGDDDFFTYAA